MIKANELRIGNLINYATYDMSNGNNILVPVVVDVNIIKAIELSPDLNVYHPIQLSQEILERAGLVKDIIDGWNWHIDFMLFVVRKLIAEDGYTVSISDCCICEIKYLHQLQNLYFALTGNELDLKL